MSVSQQTHECSTTTDERAAMRTLAPASGCVDESALLPARGEMSVRARTGSRRANNVDANERYATTGAATNPRSDDR